MTRNNAVLPANGQPTPGRAPQKSVRVELSDVEKDLAVRQWENGAMGNHYKTGKPVANKEQAVEQWAYRKAMASRSTAA